MVQWPGRDRTLTGAAVTAMPSRSRLRRSAHLFGTVLSAPQDQVEEQALSLVRQHALRAMDAWHLATATLTVPTLAEPGEPIAFASRDHDQAAVAELRGFNRI